jgi:ABC-type Fe3+/spermidine/putrescine transport system ATPase subunit
MTVLKNVEYALRLDKTKKEHAREIAMEMLRQVGLEEHAHKKPNKLSGGQQQRVAIARTLALNPDIILFDEPMSALDVDTRMVLRQELKDLQRKFKNTMIYITHDQEEAFAMSDRIMVMDRGVIRQIDTPDNIIRHPADDYVWNFVIRNIQLKIDSLSRFAQPQEERVGAGQ